MAHKGFPGHGGLLRGLGVALAAVLVLTGPAGGAEHASERFRQEPPGVRHGHVVGRLPAGHRSLWVGGVRYFYYAGVFYRPTPSGFVVVAAPIGAVVVILPPGYTSVWVGGVQYFLYNGVYYRKVPTGYVVVAPPPPAVVTPPSAGSPPGAPPPPVTAAWKVSVTSPLLNVRLGPGPDQPVIGQIRQGDILQVVGSAPGWLYVQLPNGELGWVMEKFTVRLDQPAEG